MSLPTSVAASGRIFSYVWIVDHAKVRERTKTGYIFLNNCHFYLNVVQLQPQKKEGLYHPLPFKKIYSRFLKDDENN